ncbi:metallophosphoesterase [Modestobacter sp. VKM Ac-2979]|uniref:metallophosphoesterase n=1 Tax=unclassified Modestobacter TaxID=2643866 RepID=UPI0022AB95CC|nr:MULTISPECIES: metallophosphoesterase [unclassified Modestobacter]MCZ2810870.1 metallophosphoesterase [Modestobacter sp. VKM Ac-2979]MCZ2840383.1 metallophosphoesterase [Modestobacter sp. VKM Ac-2980]
MSLIGLLGFGLTVLLVMVLLHGYLWWRLVRSTTRPGRVRRRLTVLLVVLAVLPVLVVLLRGRLSVGDGVLDWVGYTWLGLAFYLFLATLATEPVRVVARLVQRGRRPEHVAVAAGTVAAGTVSEPSGAGTVPDRPDETVSTEPGSGAVRADRPVPDPSRRLFLARTLAVGAGAVAVGTAGTGVVLANSAPVVRRVPIRIPRLDPALAGLRIVTFSDGHLSSTYGGRRFERLVETVNAQRPDVVAIVGDLVDGEVSELREDVAPLADLVSDQGVYFVTGNHEYFVDTGQWLRHLSTLGVDVLRNERVSIGRGASTVDLAGIDDRTAAASGLPGHGADLDAALDGRDDSVPVVLLAHQPVQVEQARAAGVDLQLSGHTHGGQLWPFDYAVLLDQPVVEGWSQQGDTQLYVSSGAGYWGPPMRVGARPEVTVIELQPGTPTAPPR